MDESAPDFVRDQAHCDIGSNTLALVQAAAGTAGAMRMRSAGTARSPARVVEADRQPAAQLQLQESNVPKGVNGFTTLYRAVGPSELTDIQKAGVLRNLGSAEGKYFTTSAEAASSYAKQAVSGFGDPPYTLIQTQVPKKAFEGLSPATVDRGIPAWVIPNERLQGLAPEVLDWMPISK